MVLSLVWEVTARYGFNAPTEWAYDMTFMLYGTFFMLGSAWTLQRGGHIRTDSFYSKWTQRTQARVDLVCYLVFFFPAIAIFAWLGWEFFVKSYGQNERIVTSPWLPIVWPFKFMMPALRGAAAAAGHRRVRALLGARVRDRRRRRRGRAGGDGEVADVSRRA